jgi:hypothetical protein
MPGASSDFFVRICCLSDRTPAVALSILLFSHAMGSQELHVYSPVFTNLDRTEPFVPMDEYLNHYSVHRNDGEDIMI